MEEKYSDFNLYKNSLISQFPLFSLKLLRAYLSQI